MPTLPPEELHERLWSKIDSRGRLKLHIGELAKEIGRDYDTTWYFVDRLRKQRRIRKVHTAVHGLGTYEVTDPATYDPDMSARPLRWG